MLDAYVPDFDVTIVSFLPFYPNALASYSEDALQLSTTWKQQNFRLISLKEPGINWAGMTECISSDDLHTSTLIASGTA